ncbi:SAM-dependent methyltransferase [Pseudomonas aeruginosa]
MCPTRSMDSGSMPRGSTSCGYFKATDDTLDQAQRNKLEHICRKLRLQRGERLLDIGCGWGALVCWAAREHGVRAHGITLSQQQLEYARERIRSEGLQDLVTVELRDYRDLEGHGRFRQGVKHWHVRARGTREPTWPTTRWSSGFCGPGGLFLKPRDHP